MSRLQQLFQQKNKNVLNIYCTAGYPQLQSTLPVMQALQANGADIIELGMPYSDPLADGETIQGSSHIALENGMTIARLFEQLRDFRTGGTSIKIPVVLMGYLNPVLQFGFENFCRKAAETGIDGLIIPDVPEYEYEKFYQPVLKKYGLDFIFLITPETSEARVKKLDDLSSGFLYAVSSSATTGSKTDAGAIEKYLQRLQTYSLKNPVLVGFGIKDKASFDNVCRYANGGIIGSAFIRAMENVSDIAGTTKTFMQNILH